MAWIAGIDVGSRMTKAVILDDTEKKLVACATLVSGHDLAKAAEGAFEAALKQAGLSRDQVVYVAATGYGRYRVPFRNVQITEITCHSKGAHFLFPGTRSVLDVGAQNSRAIRVGDSGRVIRFRMNDKCASGAGRFLERVARGLELDLNDIGTLSVQAENPLPMSSICAVLAESEVINLVTLGSQVGDILAGTHTSMAERIVALLRQVGVEEEVTLTGGVTKNIGMVKALEGRLGLRLNVSQEAEYAGAMGAALLAVQRVEKLRASGSPTQERQAA